MVTDYSFVTICQNLLATWGP